MPTLEWIGKDKIVNHHMDVPFRVLERKYSFDEKGQHSEDNGSENMIIHGDNLDSLKALLPKYEGKIKCIYIDPPYNTGNDIDNGGWIYSDNVNDPKIKKWLDEVVGKEGEDLSRHDKWLCMMYPRLKLLQKLLADDGLIFISIDDNEQANLKIICDEILGKSNFLTQFTWRTDGNFDNQAKVKICHEYILCYLKTPTLLGLPSGIDPSVSEGSKLFKPEIRNTLVKNGPKNPMSEIILPVGFPCAIDELTIFERKDSDFPYYHNTAYIKEKKLTNETVVESGWQSKDLLLEYIKNNCNDIVDSKGQRTRFEISKTGAIEMIKVRNDPSHVISVLSGLGSTQNMGIELKKMGITFPYPKPTKLLEYILGFYLSDGSIVLDSFAGTGVTGHAVLNKNKTAGGQGKFRFILIEMMKYAESITAERIKKVITGFDGSPGTGGSFSYYELGKPLLMPNGQLNEEIEEDKIREYIFYSETRTSMLPFVEQENKHFLGENNGVAYYFYYKKSQSTTLDHKFLSSIKTKSENYVIYADINLLSDKEMKEHNITFKKIPRDIKAV